MIIVLSLARLIVPNPEFVCDLEERTLVLSEHMALHVRSHTLQHICKVAHSITSLSVGRSARLKLMYRCRHMVEVILVKCGEPSVKQCSQPVRCRANDLPGVCHLKPTLHTGEKLVYTAAILFLRGLGIEVVKVPTAVGKRVVPPAIAVPFTYVIVHKLHHVK